MVSNWRIATVLAWADEEETGELLYRFQVDVRPIVVGNVNLRELRKELGFIKDKAGYAVYLRGTPANHGQPVPEPDCQTIIQALRANR